MLTVNTSPLDTLTPIAPLYILFEYSSLFLLNGIINGTYMIILCVSPSTLSLNLVV